MKNAEIISDYFKHFFSGRARHSEVREWLTDDFRFRDPLMSADSADDYVNQLTRLGDDLEVRVEVKATVAEGDCVVAQVDVDGPKGPIPFVEWFTLSDGKIASLDVYYDPRSFMNRDADA